MTPRGDAVTATERRALLTVSSDGPNTDSEVSPLDWTAESIQCGKCHQPGVHLVGTDRRGRPACADCTHNSKEGL